MTSKGGSDECDVRAILRGERPGPIDSEHLRRTFRRARAAIEAELKAALAAWREQPNLFWTSAAEQRAIHRGLPLWAASAARRAAIFYTEAEELSRLAETYDAQVVVSRCEGRALAREPVLQLLTRLEDVLSRLRACLPQLRSARSALDSLPPETEVLWGANVAGSPTSAASTQKGQEVLDVVEDSNPYTAYSTGREQPRLPLVIIQAAEPRNFRGQLRSGFRVVKQACFEFVEVGVEYVEAFARLAGLVETEALGDACAPWDIVLKPISPLTAVIEISVATTQRCLFGLGQMVPTFGRFIKVPRLSLGYWKIRGLAAPVRMMCVYAGIDCEDVQYEARLTSTGKWICSDWEVADKPRIRAKNVFAQLPYVVNHSTEEVLAQSSAVALYVGSILRLNGPSQACRILNEQVFFHVQIMWREVRDLVYPSNQNQDRYEFKASLKTHLETTLPAHYEKLESWLQQQGSGYFVSWRPCCADFHVWEMLDQHEEMAKAFGHESPMKYFALLKEFHCSFQRLWRLERYFDSDDSRLPINNKMAYFK